MMNIIEAIEAIRESDEQYNTTHCDAGDAYSHMPREGGWAYHNGDDRLQAFIKANDIDTHGLTIEIADLVLDGFTMEPGHTLDHTVDNVFNVDTYAIGEIECHIEYSTLEEMTGQLVNFAQLEELNNNDHCIRPNGDDCFLVYTVTDATWKAQVTATELQELIDNEVD